MEERSGCSSRRGEKSINDANGIAKARNLRSASEALDRVTSEVFERHSTIDERILLREALIAGRADIQLEELRKEIETRIGRVISFDGITSLFPAKRSGWNGNI